MSAGRAVNDANSSLDTIVHMDLLLEDSFVGQITIADATAIHALRTVCGQHSDCSSLLTLHGDDACSNCRSAGVGAHENGVNVNNFLYSKCVNSLGRLRLGYGRLDAVLS